MTTAPKPQHIPLAYAKALEAERDRLRDEVRRLRRVILEDTGDAELRAVNARLREALGIAEPLLRKAAERGTLDGEGVNLELEAADQAREILGNTPPCRGDYEQYTGGDHDKMDWRCDCGAKAEEDCPINAIQARAALAEARA